MNAAIPPQELLYPSEDLRPLLTDSEKESFRSLMATVLTRAGRNNPGPMRAALDAFNGCIQYLAVEPKSRPLPLPAPPPVEEKKKGAQGGNENSVSHGLTSKQHSLIKGEDPEEYEALKESYRALYAPRGEWEDDLVVSMANDRWRLRRIKRLEACLLERRIEMSDNEIGRAAGSSGIEKTLALYARYQSTLELSLKRTHKLLQDQRAADSSAGVPPAKPQHVESGAGVPPAIPERPNHSGAGVPPANPQEPSARPSSTPQNEELRNESTPAAKPHKPTEEAQPKTNPDQKLRNESRPQKATPPLTLSPTPTMPRELPLLDLIERELNAKPLETGPVVKPPIQTKGEAQRRKSAA